MAMRAFEKGWYRGVFVPCRTLFYLEDNLMEWIIGKIIYIIVAAFLCLIIAFIVDRENRTKNNKEKILLRLLMVSGNLVISGIIILCLWAGFSYI